MRHGDVSYVDEAGAPVKPEDVPLTPRGREQAAAARDALANVEFDLVVASDLPRTLETAEIVAPGQRDRALAGAGGVARRPARRDPARRARGCVRRRAPGQGRGAALPRRRVARRGARPRPPRAGATARPRVAHRSRGPPRRRQPDRHLVRALGRPHLLRHVRAGAGVHQRARRRRRRLDRPHGQLRPLRPAPPRPDDDDGAPLGAAEAVPRRAPVAPSRLLGQQVRAADHHPGAHPLLVEPGRRRTRRAVRRAAPAGSRSGAGSRGRARRRTPARRGTAADRSRGGRAPRRGCCGGGSRRGRGRRGGASMPAESSSAIGT